MKHGVFLCCLIMVFQQNLSAQIKKGLWGVRREDSSTVFSAGFRAIRPPYPGSGSKWKYDNYKTTADYAQWAKRVGFDVLVYDCGLMMLYSDYLKYITTGATNINNIVDMDGIKREIKKHMDDISKSGIKFFPYLDEPDVMGIRRLVYNGKTIIPQGKARDSWDIIYVRQFDSLVVYTDALARNAYGSHLIIATTSPEWIDPSSSDLLAKPNPAYPSFYYNQHAEELLSTRYWWPDKMKEILNTLHNCYHPPYDVSQIMNFFDSSFGGFRFSGLADDSTYGVIHQITVNQKHLHPSSYNWFYEGEYINRNLTVRYYDKTSAIKYVNSKQQWKMLLDALGHYENAKK